MYRQVRTETLRDDTHMFRPSDVVDGALRLASTRLRNVARIERLVSADLVNASISLGELVRSFTELVCAAAGRLEAPRPGASRWLRVMARRNGESLELSVEHAAAEGSPLTIAVPIEAPSDWRRPHHGLH